MRRKCWPSTLTMTSPGWRPAVPPASPAATATTRSPIVGSPSQAMPVKIANASRTFIDDARDEDQQLGRVALRGERARIVGVVAVLAFELDEAADRQPVERVEGLALRAQDLGPRREPDAELEHPDVGEPGDDEVAELMDDHEDRRGSG